MNAVDAAWLARRMGEGSTTIEGSLAELHLDEVLMSLAGSPHRYEIAVTCPDGGVARIDVGSGLVLAARLGEERDPRKVLAILTHLQPEGFRVRPLREPLAADDPPAGTIPELLIQALNLSEDLPTVVEWGNEASDRTAAMEAEEELKPTELVSREALAVRLGLASLTAQTEPNAPVGLVPEPGLLPEPEPPTEPGLATVGWVPTADLVMVSEILPTPQEAEAILTSWEPAPQHDASSMPAPRIGLTFSQVGVLGVVCVGLGFLAGVASVGVLALIVLAVKSVSF